VIELCEYHRRYIAWQLLESALERARLSARADIPEQLIIECKYANNLLGMQDCWQGLKSVALQLK